MVLWLGLGDEHDGAVFVGEGRKMLLLENSLDQ